MCILQFRTKAKIYSKIMQNMKNATKQFIKDASMASAVRRQIVGVGGVLTVENWRWQRP